MSTPGAHAATVTLALDRLFSPPAKLDQLAAMVRAAQAQAGQGNVVILTGQAPVWLYLSVAHALHGLARRLIYRSPAAGDVLIFDHDPL